MKGLSRVGGEEAVWHVMNRAAHRVRIFASDAHMQQFTRLLRTFALREKLGVAAYCVMPNHYHVLVRGPGDRLTRCFHEVDRLWAKEWNEVREQAGHVFQGPFLSFLQHGAGWVVRTSAYIHLNPIPSLAQRPEEYRWSSYAAYNGEHSDASWIDSSIVLRFYGETEPKARISYREFVETRLGWRTESPQVTEERVVSWTVARELAPLVGKVGQDLEISPEEARRIVAYHGRRTLGLPLPDLAMTLGFRNTRALSTQLSRLRSRMAKEPWLQTLVLRAGTAVEKLGETNQTL